MHNVIGDYASCHSFVSGLVLPFASAIVESLSKEVWYLNSCPFSAGLFVEEPTANASLEPSRSNDLRLGHDSNLFHLLQAFDFHSDAHYPMISFSPTSGLEHNRSTGHAKLGDIT